MGLVGLIGLPARVFNTCSKSKQFLRVKVIYKMITKIGGGIRPLTAESRPRI